MKTRLRNNKEVAHVWAQQKQSEGHGSNFFFDGPSIYSYGHHFEIARFVQSGVVLFTSRDYSNSTSRHKSYAWRAIPDGIKIFTVPSLEKDHPANIAYYLEKYQAQIKKVKNSLGNYKWNKETLEEIKREAKEYLFAFSKEIPKKLFNGTIKTLEAPAFTSAEVKRLDERYNRAIEREKLKEQKRDEIRKLNEIKRAEENKLTIEKWKAGERVSIPWGLPVFLRLRDKLVETSQGAFVPIPAAVDMWNMFKSKTLAPGYTIGDYTVNEVRADIIKIGCHEIPCHEMERIETELNQRGE